MYCTNNNGVRNPSFSLPREAQVLSSVVRRKKWAASSSILLSFIRDLVLVVSPLQQTEGSEPEWLISSFLYSRDIPFWSGTLEMYSGTMILDAQLLPSVEAKWFPQSFHLRNIVRNAFSIHSSDSKVATNRPYQKAKCILLLLLFQS